MSKKKNGRRCPFCGRLETKVGTREAVEHLMARCELFEGVRAKWRRKWGTEWELKYLVKESGAELVVGMVEEVRRREGELSWNP